MRSLSLLLSRVPTPPPHLPSLANADSDTEKQKFVADAQAEATKDSKKALRDSGVYEQHELEPIEHDEQTANTVM